MRQIMKCSIATAYLFLFACVAGAQTQPAAAPQIIQQAQTVRIPVNVYNQDTTPAATLTAADFHLTVDGAPASFQLSRPWDNTLDPKTGQPVDRPNLLILLPLGAPTMRADAIDEAVRYFDKVDSFDWNVSIMDDTGQQTAYTTDLQQVREDMHAVAKENPDYAGVDMYAWRRKAALAIENMRELPGRRVVVALGDVFHEQIYSSDFTLVYDNFEAHDLAGAARSSGAFIYAAESFQEMGRIRTLWPYYYTLGFGPWLLLDKNDQVEGWITNFFSDTINQVRQEKNASYVLEHTLTPAQMDGQLHRIAVTMNKHKLFLSAPSFYAAPDRQQLLQLASAPLYMQKALLHPGGTSPLEILPRADYFPSARSKGGTQIFSLGFFWNSSTPPPRQLNLMAQLVQTDLGISYWIAQKTLPWNSKGPVWRFGAGVLPGFYQLRVAASDDSGKVVTSEDFPFTVDTRGNELVLVSSLVVGKDCEFDPQADNMASQGGAQSAGSLLLAGHCIVGPDPIGFYSPQDVLWTLVRLTPTGKFVNKPATSWKGRFTLRNAKGKIMAEQPVLWIEQGQGSYVGTAALPLAGGKLTNGDYAVAVELNGPGIGRDYYADSPVTLYGFSDATAPKKKKHR